MDDSTALHQRVSQVFAANRRPERFTNRDHCDECAEHDDTLRNASPETIGLAELGNPGWDPLCFVYPEAFKYYFPAMVRLALDPDLKGEYLDQFLFHLTYDWEQSRFFRHFTLAEREVTLAVFNHIWQLLENLPAGWMAWPNIDDWLAAIELWESLVAQAESENGR